MTQTYIGELRPFPYNFAPRNWMTCQGQLLAISQNTALFSILGTTYGGNGQTTFALPNLSGRVTNSAGGGTGPGLSPYDLGEMAGSETVTLISTEMPTHNHTVDVWYQTGAVSQYSVATPGPGVHLSRMFVKAQTGAAYSNGQLWNTPPIDTPTQLNAQALSIQGGSQPHENRQPYLTLLWCICTQGVFPPRN